MKPTEEQARNLLLKLMKDRHERQEFTDEEIDWIDELNPEQ